FVERERAAAFALHVTGADGASLVKNAGKAAEGAADAAAVERAVVSASRKGPAGVAWLRSGGWRVLVRPHPIVGVLKGLGKGTIPDVIPRLFERMGAQAWWLLPLLAAWAFAETAMIGARVRGPRERYRVERPRARQAA